MENEKRPPPPERRFRRPTGGARPDRARLRGTVLAEDDYRRANRPLRQQGGAGAAVQRAVEAGPRNLPKARLQGGSVQENENL